jgi:hypothetical protein
VNRKEQIILPSQWIEENCNDKQDKHGDQSVNTGVIDLSSDICKEDRGQGVS